MTNKETIKSVGTNQIKIMHDILDLYNIEEITVDPTYSIGNFYKRVVVDGEAIQLPEPKYKFDVVPQTEDTVQIEPLKPLPLADGSCKCINIDLPFIISPHNAPSAIDPKDGSCITMKRFASFYPVPELLETYYFFIKEAYRVLEDGGYCIFKCQNTVTGGKQLNTPEYTWLCAESVGFDTVDKFVLTAPSRLIGKVKKQMHSRRYESYFYVFKKSQSKKSKYLTFDNENVMREILDGFWKHNFNFSKGKYVVR